MAYITATLQQKDAPLPDGKTRVVIRFTGDAGEPVRDRELYVDGGMAALDIRRWCIAEASRMGSGKSVVDALTIGQTISLAAIAPPVATAQDIWIEKARRLKRLTDLGLTNATAVSDIAALRSDVNATYLQAYVTAV